MFCQAFFRKQVLQQKFQKDNLRKEISEQKALLSYFTNLKEKIKIVDNEDKLTVNIHIKEEENERD